MVIPFNIKGNFGKFFIWKVLTNVEIILYKTLGNNFLVTYIGNYISLGTMEIYIWFTKMYFIGLWCD